VLPEIIGRYVFRRQAHQEAVKLKILAFRMGQDALQELTYVNFQVIGENKNGL
jgi:hypothetical protein